MALDQVDIDKIDPHTRQPIAEKEMGFLDHLEELRWHIIRALGAIVFVAIGMFIAGPWLVDNIIFAPRYASFASYQAICSLSNAIGLGDSLCFTPAEFDVITVGFAEAFIVHIKIAVIGGFIVAFPYVFWEVWRFIRPGLYPKEQKAARGIVFICSTLFLIGVLFGYFIIAPFAVNFLGGYTLGDVKNTASLTSFVGYMTMFTVPAGIAFELPVVIYFLAKVGLVTPDFLRQYRRHAIIVILVAAAIITPPDLVTQCLIGIPLFFLYEISILLAARVQKEAEEL